MILNLSDCQAIINKHLNEIDLPEFPVHLYEPIRYMLNLNAKRLRPTLVLMGCNIFSDNIDCAIYPALAIEVFHNFTLVHDDIMDRSEMRRGQQTVHVKWSPNVAILSGDAMVIKAYEFLTHPTVKEIHSIFPVFNRTALQVCEGQQYDMDYEVITEISNEEYLRMVECKTAVLLAASLKIGAMSGGASDTESDLLYEFGRNIGIAFQLQDDLLDVYADTSEFGKKAGNDIVTNKKTILLVEALKTSTGNLRKALMSWLLLKEFDNQEKINAIRDIYSSLGLMEKVGKMVRDYHEKALCSLDRLKVENLRKDELLRFSDYLMNRKK